MVLKLGLAGRGVAFAAALALSGCFVESGGGVIAGPATGRVTLRWTINGTTDPNQCNQAQATTVLVSVSSGNRFVGDYVASCPAFATTVDLAPGTYTATVHLRNSAGTPRTTAISVIPFNVVDATNLDIPIDFPANSFL